jgi:hypothetical protein
MQIPHMETEGRPVDHLKMLCTKESNLLAESHEQSFSLVFQV